MSRADISHSLNYHINEKGNEKKYHQLQDSVNVVIHIVSFWANIYKKDE